MQPNRRLLAVSSLACLIALAAGCGSGVTLAPVKGTVTLDGKALASGTIRFESSGRPATGKIVNGEIVEVTTYEPNDGAPLGNHKIAVWATADAASAVVPDPGQAKVDSNYMSGKSLIRSIYNDPETSGLTAEIKSGDNVVTIKLVSTE